MAVQFAQGVYGQTKNKSSFMEPLLQGIGQYVLAQELGLIGDKKKPTGAQQQAAQQQGMPAGQYSFNDQYNPNKPVYMNQTNSTNPSQFRQTAATSQPLDMTNALGLWLQKLLNGGR